MRALRSWWKYIMPSWFNLDKKFCRVWNETRPERTIVPSHGDITHTRRLLPIWLWLITRMFNIACNDFHKMKIIIPALGPWTFDFSQLQINLLSGGNCYLEQLTFVYLSLSTLTLLKKIHKRQALLWDHHVTLLTTAGRLIMCVCEWVCIEMEKREQKRISCIVILLI